MKKLLLVFLVSINFIYSQVGIGTTTPAATSLLDITSTSKGVLVPRMTWSQCGNIVNPATGLLVYVTDGAAGFYYYTGSAWISLTSSSVAVTGLDGLSDAKVGGDNFAGGLLLGVQWTGTLNFANYNTGVGQWGTLSSLTSGDNNCAFGYVALSANTSGSSNNAFGHRSLAANTTGNNNVANGDYSLNSNTTGSYNIANGVFALRSNTTANYNVANGDEALYNNTTGSFNVANGDQSLRENTTGYSNTAIGARSGNSVTTGINLTLVGHNAQPLAANSVNQVTLGDASISSLRCATQTISSLSDKRDKEKITKITEGIEFVKKLNPVTFEWNTRDKAKVGIKSAGFIAQELLELQNKSKIGENLDLVSTENPEKLEARYGNLLPVLVKAIQEQQEIISKMQNEINKLKSQNEKDFSSKE